MVLDEMIISLLCNAVGEAAAAYEFPSTLPPYPPFREPTSAVGDTVGNEQNLSDWISKEYLDVSSFNLLSLCCLLPLKHISLTCCARAQQDINA